MELILDAAMLSPVARARFEDMHLTVISDKTLLQAISEMSAKRQGGIVTRSLVRQFWYWYLLNQLARCPPKTMNTPARQ